MIERKHITELWSRMAAIYGHKWLSSYGPEDADDTWYKGLRDLDAADFATGLRGCLAAAESRRRVGDEDWPPTLGEFRSLCKPQRPVYHEPMPALPRPKLTPEQLREVEADIERLRETTRKATAEAEREARERRMARFRPREIEREPGSDDDKPEVAA